MLKKRRNALERYENVMPILTPLKEWHASCVVVSDLPADEAVRQTEETESKSPFVCKIAQVV